MNQRSDNAVFSYRLLNLISFAVGAGTLAYSASVLEPLLGGLDCALCQVIRASLLTITLIALIAFIHNPWRSGQRFYALLSSLAGTLGLMASSRYLWLVNADPNRTECSSGLKEWLISIPLSPEIETYLEQNTACVPPWEYLGFTLAHYSAAIFIILLLISWKILIRRPKDRLFF